MGNRDGQAFTCVAQAHIADIFVCVTFAALPIRTPMQAGRIVQRLRHRQHRTQAQLAHEIGRSQATISRLETGLHQTTLGDLLSALHALDAEVSLIENDCRQTPAPTED